MSCVNGPDALLKDSNGCYFLDRCPRPFEVILGFLRTGELTNLNGCTKRQLEVEADFFGLSGLQEILRQRGQAPKAQEDLPDWMRELEAVDKEIHRISRLGGDSNTNHVTSLSAVLQHINCNWRESPASVALLETTKKLQERKSDILKNGPKSAE